MIVKFSFAWGNPPVSEEDELKIRELVPDLKLDKDRKPETWITHTSDLRALYQLWPTAKLELKSFEGESVPRLMLEAIDELKALVNKLQHPTATHEQNYNERVHVHVPGLGLLMMNEVKVQTDCCTEALQDFLDEGWRIVAACPQPDQRRPDYVLGRTRQR